MGALHIRRRSVHKFRPVLVTFATLHNAAILLPTITGARTIAIRMRVNDPSLIIPGAYIMDNRNRNGSGSGIDDGYVAKAFHSSASLYNGITLIDDSLSGIMTGNWLMAFVECSFYQAPTIFGRYSWNAGGATGIFENVSVSDIRVYNRVLTNAEKIDDVFPDGGLLAQYLFTQSVINTNAGAATYPLADATGNGHTAGIGINQGGRIDFE